MKWIYLTIAIIAEIFSTSMLKMTEEFTKIIPSILVILGYLVSFYFLTKTIKYIQVGVAYAIWSGLGTVIITVIGVMVYKQKLDMYGVIGMAFIVIGVIIMNLFSKTMIH